MEKNKTNIIHLLPRAGWVSDLSRLDTVIEKINLTEDGFVIQIPEVEDPDINFSSYGNTADFKDEIAREILKRFGCTDPQELVGKKVRAYFRPKDLYSIEPL